MNEKVFLAGEVRVEAHAEFKHRLYRTVDCHRPARRSEHIGDDLEHRALAAPVAADEADAFATVDFQGNIP